MLVVVATLTPTNIFGAAEGHLVALAMYDPSLPFPRGEDETVLRTPSRTRCPLTGFPLGFRLRRPWHITLHKSIKIEILGPLRVGRVPLLRLQPCHEAFDRVVFDRAFISCILVLVTALHVDVSLAAEETKVAVDCLIIVRIVQML